MIKLFKIFETRTAGLSEDEFIKLLNENCKDFINNPVLLQRSKINNDGDFSFIDPTISIRKPFIDMNDGVYSEHNTLLMDNLPSWRFFPKRSQSIIGVTNEDGRTLFGKYRYLIIPYDDAKFGIAPSIDLWSCNTYTTPSKIDKISFDNRLSKTLSNNNLPHTISDDSFTKMMSDMEILYNKWLEDGKNWVWIRGNSIEAIFKYIKSKNISVLQGFDEVLSPEKFEGTHLDKLTGYHVVDYKKLSEITIGDNCNYEFWTDSKCLLYLMPDTGNWHQARDDIRYAFKKFCEDYL